MKLFYEQDSEKIQNREILENIYNGIILPLLKTAKIFQFNS